jgi:hypothetical protein
MKRYLERIVMSIVAVCTLLQVVPAEDTDFAIFDVVDNGLPDPAVPEIAPWKTIALDSEYGGQWVVAGDVDGDGAVEIVSAENFNEEDTHYTSAVAAQRLDGSTLWRWGKPEIGRKNWHHDVACQIVDWDGDGKNEVVVSAETDIVELDGATGAEKRRIPIEKGASDCLVFCDLSGKGRPTDVLAKDRYENIWAYNHAGELLWHTSRPGGYRTAHQPRPMDIDGDGRDEIMAGFAMLNHDGALRWVFESKTTDLNQGHLDCARVLNVSENLDEVRIALTCCGANNIAVLNGHGKAIWEYAGHHFESIQLADIVPERPGLEILADIDHRPRGEGPLWIFGGDGTRLGQYVTTYARHHRVVDWTGDGIAEILNGDNQALYTGSGKRIGTFLIPGSQAGAERPFEMSILVGDCDGDGRQDVLLITLDSVYLYRNEHGSLPKEPVPLGTGMNVTLY